VVDPQKGGHGHRRRGTFGTKLRKPNNRSVETTVSVVEKKPAGVLS
jgi:hypothetical protein